MAPKKSITKAMVKSKVVTNKKAIVKASASAKKVAPVKKNIAAPTQSRHIISRAKGDELRNRFKNSKASNSLNTINFSDGREFDISLFTALLKLKDIKKIRIYNAVNEMNEHTLVITGVNVSGMDIYLKYIATAIPAKNLLKSATPPSQDGVGDMGDQCTEPSYKPA